MEYLREQFLYFMKSGVRKVMVLKSVLSLLHILMIIAIQGLDFESAMELVVHFDSLNNVGACSLINLTIIDDLRLEENESLLVEIISIDPELFVDVAQSSTSVLIIDNDSTSISMACIVINFFLYRSQHQLYSGILYC